MKIDAYSQDGRPTDNSALIVYNFEDESRVIGQVPSSLYPEEQITSYLEDLLSRDKYDGADHDVHVMDLPGDEIRWLVFTGLGDPGEITAERFRRFTAAAGREAVENGARDLILSLPRPARVEADVYRLGRILYESLYLGGYDFQDYKTDEDTGKRPDAVRYIRSDEEDNRLFDEGIRDGSIYAKGTCLARDLSNEPPSRMSPDQLVREAENLESDSISVTVFRRSELREMGMEPTLGVGAGSTIDPAQVELVYSPEQETEDIKEIGLAGKGITFDSGGIQIKSHKGMEDMKYDMAGAAAVLGVFSVLEEIEPDVKVRGMIGCSENMTGPDAQKVRDVVKSYGGKTIEIFHTDAEGRLVLSDALGYLAEQDVDEIIDLATLTGTIIAALGRDYMGMFGNDRDVLDRLDRAADVSGERVCELPLIPDYRQDLDSAVADIRNVGSKRGAGAVVAGLFLEHFVEDTPWVHLDIAGPSAVDETRDYRPEGGTGVGVRTLLDYIRSYEKE